MKLIIDIPEEIYKASQIIDVKYEDVIQIPLEVIVNGTLLSPGHGRLIDENYLLSILQCEEYEICTWRNCSDCNREKSIKRRQVLEAPTIIPADKEKNE